MVVAASARGGAGGGPKWVETGFEWEGPARRLVHAGLECALDPFLGSHEVGGWLLDSTDIDVTMTIESYAGDWHSEDPVDPRRLLGHFAGDLVGPFEAIHCAELDVFYDNCA